MKRFRLCDTVIDVAAERAAQNCAQAGAFVTFEGCVRDHNDGRAVARLDYQAWTKMAEREGEAVLDEAFTKFTLRDARAVHRVGRLAIGDVAVWIGVAADHRAAAFAGCCWIIDAIKQRVPIWKNEHYSDGESGWLHP